MKDVKTPTLPKAEQQLDVYKAEYGLTRSQIKMIKDNVARGATDSQLKLFLYQSKSVGLNPLKQQCRLVIRNSANGPVATFQTTIDGYRAIAHRSGVYAGMDDIEYDTDTADHPNWARVKVYKMVKGVKVAFVAKARWIEYLPPEKKQQFMWNKMPYLMLGKVAEALALRKAFPEDLAGIYTDEEMHQASEVMEYPHPDDTPKPSMGKAKPRGEEIPGDYTESEPGVSSRTEDPEPIPEESAETGGADAAPTNQEPAQSVADAENVTDATQDPYKMDKATLIAYLAREKGKRYNAGAYTIIRNDLFGTKKSTSNITKAQLLKFYEQLEREALND